MTVAALAGLLQPTTSFTTVAGALAAVRCWLDAAATVGHDVATLCAVIDIKDNETRALLGTRALIADELPRGRPLAGAVLRNAPGEAFVLVSKDDAPASGDGFGNVYAVLAVTAARAAAQ